MLQYIITPSDAASASRLASQAIEAGCKWLELKAPAEMPDEQVTQIFQSVSPLCRDKEVCLIIADRVELAKNLQADGVHLYHNDLPVSAARVTLEAAPIIVVSIDSADAATALRGYDIDVLFYQFSNPDSTAVSQVSEIALALKENNMELPLVAAGKIDAQFGRQLLDAGALGLALLSTDIPPQDISQLRNSL